MTSPLDLLLVDIVHSYLDTAASRTAGVPAANVCALLKQDADTDDIDPRLCVTAVEQGEGRVRQVNVSILARGSMARSVSAPWLSAVWDRLADRTAFFVHLASLTVAQRSGWQLEEMTRPFAARIQREEGGVIESGVGLTFHLTV